MISTILRNKTNNTNSPLLPPPSPTLPLPYPTPNTPAQKQKKTPNPSRIADVWSEAISSNSITEDETDDMKLALATAFYK